MPRFSVFLTETDVDNHLVPRTGLSNVFLQPQPYTTSSNPASKSPDSDSIVLTEAPSSPGVYYANITNPVPRYDLYVSGNKETNFSGSDGFNLGSTKSWFFKRNVEIVSTAWQTPEDFVTGSGKLATPDGAQTWPFFASSNLPTIVILEPSEASSGFLWRAVRIVRGTVGVSAGHLEFQLSLDPNGPDLANYYCDILIMMP